MYGSFLTQLGNYTCNRYGDDCWQEVRALAGVPLKIYIPSEIYDDNELKTLIATVSTKIGVEERQLLEQLGQFIAPEMLKLYSTFLEPEWKTLDLLMNVPNIIERLTDVIDKDKKITHPTLDPERIDHNSLSLKYESPRQLCPLAVGLIKGTASFFNEGIEINEVSCLRQGNYFCQFVVRTRPKTNDD